MQTVKAQFFSIKASMFMLFTVTTFCLAALDVSF